MTATEKLIKIHKLKDYCFMGYPVSKESYFTFHHCKKKADGGTRTIDNGAIITLDAHRDLNEIERNEIEIYNLINEILIEINQSKKHPTPNQWRRIKHLLQIYEESRNNELTLTKTLKY